MHTGPGRPGALDGQPGDNGHPAADAALSHRGAARVGHGPAEEFGEVGDSGISIIWPPGLVRYPSHDGKSMAVEVVVLFRPALPTAEPFFGRLSQRGKHFLFEPACARREPLWENGHASAHK